MKNKSIIKYKINLKTKLPKEKLKTIEPNERTNMTNKKKDKTLIMDNLSK